MLIMQISVQKGNIHLLDACKRNLDTVYVYKMSRYISNLSKVSKSPCLPCRTGPARTNTAQ